MPCLLRLRFFLFVLAVLALSAIAAPRPVVLELFTSNSCSSCPPAYVLLDRLATNLDDDTIQLIRLDQHVDYWNQLNWVDRYSSAAYTTRQKQYARDVFGADRIYTPQLVVNGNQEMVGSNARRVRAAIEQPASPAVRPLTIDLQRKDKTVEATVVLAGEPQRKNQTLWLALTQDNVVSRVGAGENAGRTLREDGVVRHLQPAGQPGGSISGDSSYTASLPIPADAQQATLHVVGFVQQPQTRQITAAGITDVPRRR